MVFIPFEKGICPKVNVIEQLEFELAYYDSALHHKDTPELKLLIIIFSKDRRSLGFHHESLSPNIRCNTVIYSAFCLDVAQDRINGAQFANQDTTRGDLFVINPIVYFTVNKVVWGTPLSRTTPKHGNIHRPKYDWKQTTKTI